jgi:hypothetical protein
LLGISFADAAGVAIFGLLALTPSIALLLTSAAFGGRLIAAIEGGLVEASQTASPWARRSR